MHNYRTHQTREKRGTIIEGIPPIPCIFCDFMTSIEFDLELHLYERHRIELVKLPIGKGNIDYRIEFAIKEGKKIRNTLANMTPGARERLGIYRSYSTDISIAASESRVKTGIDFILSHLDEPLFPRKLMTKELGVQVKAFDSQSMLGHFKRSDFYDCRINAYSSLLQQDESITIYAEEVRISITIIVIDLDLKDFHDSKEIIDDMLQKTLRKIKETIGGCPTVLDTGNGYHIYQPIRNIVLDDVSDLKNYTNFHKYYLSNKFLKFSEEYFTLGRSDPQHNPTVNSCLIRIPGTINSKCDKEVSIVQEWDYHRPSVEPLLPAFKKYLYSRGEIFNQNLDHNVSRPECIPRSTKYTSNQIRYIWIDALLQIPLGDYRKSAMRLIIAPYLIVVKQRPYGECIKIMMDWLNRCNCVERLSFSAEFTVRRYLQSVQRVGYRPIRLEKLQQEIPALYDIVMRKMQNRNP